MIPRALRRLGAPTCAALLLAACDDPANLAQEVAAAQGECDQDSLRVGAEACVGMMQRYAEMATEAIHTYIGGMRALDEALKRMPPANFDTTSFGVRIPGANTLPPDSARGYEAAGMPAPGLPAYNYARDRDARFDGGEPALDRSRRGDQRAAPPGRATPGGPDPRDWQGYGTQGQPPRGHGSAGYPPQSYGPGGYGPQGYPAPGYGPPGAQRQPGYGPPVGPGYGAGGYPPGYPGGAPPVDPRSGREGGYGTDPRRAVDPRDEQEGVERRAPLPPQRAAPGVLLPPGQRLGRPWLDSGGRGAPRQGREPGGPYGAYPDPREREDSLRNADSPGGERQRRP